MEIRVQIKRLHSDLDAIIPAGLSAECLAGGFGFTEGPVWVQQGSEGFLLFGDIPGNAIFKWHPTEGTSEFLRPSGYYGTNAPSGAHIGSNGLTLDREGLLIICEHGNRRLTRLEKNRSLTLLADRYEGKRLNSPNDVVCKSNGALYFTDPPYGLLRRDLDPDKELPFNGIYRFLAGELQLLFDQMNRPNGLAFSPDERRLYVANSDPEKKIWMCFDVTAEGMLSCPQVFHDATRASGEGVPDGLKVDRSGNLFCTGPGGIWIFSPSGCHLGTVEFPEIPANCGWGDDDGKTLYVTARRSIYRLRFNTVAIRPAVSREADQRRL